MDSKCRLVKLKDTDKLKDCTIESEVENHKKLFSSVSVFYSGKLSFST